MEPRKISKQEAASEVSNQEALVKVLMGPNYRKPVRTTIPGGAKLLETVDRETFPHAVYNWLRKHRFFEWTRICFAKDINEMDLEVRMIEPIDNFNGVPKWEHANYGKRWLAKRMSDHLISGQYVYVEARKDGLYGAILKNGEFDDTSPNWQPHQLALPVKRGTYA